MKLQTNVQQKPLLDLKDVAAMLKTSPRSLRRWVDGGKLPKPIKVGGKLLRWQPDVIERWVSDGCPRCR